ncbi:hypothetical protein ABK040_016718 [Willaertia magna]
MLGVVDWNTTSKSSTTHNNSSVSNLLRKGDLVWVEDKGKIFMGRIEGKVKNYQVRINRQNILPNFHSDEILLLEPSSCYPVDNTILERSNLLWSTPGCQCQAQIASKWTSFVNSSFEDTIRSSKLFTMHFGKRNTLLKNPDFQYNNKASALAIHNNGDDFVYYIQNQLKSGCNTQSLVLLGEGTKEKQVTLQQLMMSLLHKNLLPYIDNQPEKQEMFTKQIRVTIGSALNLLVMFSNMLYKKALTQTHPRKIVITCDNNNRIANINIHSNYIESMQCSNTKLRSLPIYHIFLLLVGGVKDNKYHIKDDIKFYKLFNQLETSYKDLSLLNLDITKMNKYLMEFYMDQTEVDSVYKCLSACMWLFNYNFADNSTDENDKVKAVIAELLDLNVDKVNSIFVDETNVYYTFDVLYSNVLNFIQTKINRRLTQILEEWREGPVNITNEKEISIIDIPGVMDGDHLAEVYLNALNKVVSIVNLSNEVNAIKNSFKEDNVDESTIEQLTVYEQLVEENSNEDLQAEIFANLNENSSSLEEVILQSSIYQTLVVDSTIPLVHSTIYNQMQQLVGDVTETYLYSRVYFMHCMTFSIEKETSNFNFNYCINCLRKTGIPPLLELYVGDKYSYKMEIYDYEELEIEEWIKEENDIQPILKGHNYIYFTETSVFNIIEKFSDDEAKQDFWVKLRFFADDYSDIFQNALFRMDGMFKEEGPHDKMDPIKLLDLTIPIPVIDEDGNAVDDENILTLEDTASYGLLPLTGDTSYSQIIKDRDLPHHVSCLGLTAFSHIETDHLRGQIEQITDNTGSRSRRGSAVFLSLMNDKFDGNLDFRNNKKRQSARRSLVFDEDSSNPTMSPNIEILTSVDEVQNSTKFKLLINSISEQLLQDDNVINIQPKQFRSFITFIADYWYTFTTDENDVTSFVNYQNHEKIIKQVIPFLKETMKVIYTIITKSRQQEVLSSIIREEGLLTYFIDFILTLCNDLKENLTHQKSLELFKLQFLVSLVLCTILKNDKQSCAFLTQGNYFWGIFECCILTTKRFNEDKDYDSLERKVNENLSRHFVFILSKMILDEYCYQLIKYQFDNHSTIGLKLVPNRLLNHLEKRKSFQPMLDNNYFIKTLLDCIYLIKYYDISDRNINNLVNFIQGISPLYVNFSERFRQLIEIWIHQFDKRSSYFTFLALRSLSKIYETIKKEEYTTTKIKNLFLSNNNHNVIQLSLDMGLITRVINRLQLKYSDIDNERIIFSVLYLSCLYDNVRKQFSESIFKYAESSKNTNRSNSSGDIMNTRLTIQDFTRKNLEVIMEQSTSQTNRQQYLDFVQSVERLIEVKSFVNNESITKKRKPSLKRDEEESIEQFKAPKYDLRPNTRSSSLITTTTATIVNK